MRIGLIAGSGQFPIIFAKAAKAAGYEVCAAAYHNEADPRLSEHVADIQWLHLGQLKRLIKFFKTHRIEEAVMVGAIKKTRMFVDIRPDTKALALLAAMAHTHDDGILRAFADALEKEGIRIRASTFLLPDLLAPEGHWTRRQPTAAEQADIDLGWHVAKAIGSLDIGQCVVIAKGSVLAVEAIDGTDATIARGGRLGRGKAVVVKVCKPQQDTRFDVPAVGARTIDSMHRAGARVLAIEAGHAVVFDRVEMIRRADRYGIAIASLSRLPASGIAHPGTINP